MGCTGGDCGGTKKGGKGSKSSTKNTQWGNSVKPVTVPTNPWGLKPNSKSKKK